MLFIGAEEAQSGLIVKQARALGMTAVIAEGAPAGTPLYLSTAGTANANGTIVSSPYLGNDASAAAQKFAAAYTAAYGSAPELHGAKAYDGAQIMIAALKACNACTGLNLANAIRAVHYAGLLGNFAYDSTGVGIFATAIGIITDGKISPSASQPSSGDDEAVQSFFQTLVSGLSFGAVYALVALGFSLVYRTMGLVNFAHGAGADDRRVRGVHLLPVGTAAVRGGRAGRHGGHRRDRPGHRAGAAPAREQGLRPDAHRHHRGGHRARRGRHPDLVLVRARGKFPGTDGAARHRRCPDPRRTTCW